MSIPAAGGYSAALLNQAGGDLAAGLSKSEPSTASFVNNMRGSLQVEFVGPIQHSGASTSSSERQGSLLQNVQQGFVELAGRGLFQGVFQVNFL